MPENLIQKHYGAVVEGPMGFQMPEAVARRIDVLDPGGLEPVARLVSHGIAAVRNVLPEKFNWILFACAFFLMALPVVQIARRQFISQIADAVAMRTRHANRQLGRCPSRRCARIVDPDPTFQEHADDRTRFANP